MIGCCHRWSATPIRSNPASSTARAISARVLPNRSGPPFQSKLLSCTPSCITSSFRFRLLVFEPLCDHAPAGMDVDVPGPTGSGVDVFVGRASRYDDYLAALRLDSGVAYREGDLAVLDHEDLFVGMGVQPRTTSPRRVYEEERDVRVAVQVSLEPVRRLAVRKLFFFDDVSHGLLLRSHHALVLLATDRGPGDGAQVQTQQEPAPLLLHEDQRRAELVLDLVPKVPVCVPAPGCLAADHHRSVPVNTNLNLIPFE